MKKISLIIVSILLLSFTLVFAQDVTPTAQTTAEPLQASQGKNVFAGAVSKITLDLKSAFQMDAGGNLYTSELGLKARQTLFNNFNAECYVRFIKPFSNSNAPVDVELMTAKFTYVNSYFMATAGRVEITKTISTLNYFGPYSTAGQRYLDLIGVTVPFYLKAGVPEMEEVNLPAVELSLYYFPTMLNFANTTYNGFQEYYLGQIRFHAVFFDSPTQVIANFGKGTTEYFKYSILSGNYTVDVSASVDIMKHGKINAAFGVLNTELSEKTSVVAAGLELHDFRDWLFVLDTVIFEIQFPLASATSADFNPESAPWFLVIKNKIDNFRYGIAASTANNDFTFKNILVAGVPTAYGSGNVYAPEGLQFNGLEAGGTASFYGYIGYEF